jgi:hypothetical protein
MPLETGSVSDAMGGETGSVSDAMGGETGSGNAQQEVFIVTSKEYKKREKIMRNHLSSH